jgi:hypothetical protein
MMSKRIYKSEPPIKRFDAKMKRGAGCWEWLGCKRSGYGQFCADTKRSPITAHRFSYEHFIGPIPTGMLVLHRCDNRGCVNPGHLFLGTQADNMSDKMLKGRASRADLRIEDAYAILWREASGESRISLAAAYNVNRKTVGDIARRDTWPSLSQSHD